jgi:hypothetical protein
MTLDLQQPLIRRLLQPKAEGHRPTFQVAGQAVPGIQLRFLNHVGRVHPSPHTRVEAEIDEGTNRRPVSAKEQLKRFPIACPRPLEQVARFLGGGLHLGHVGFSPDYPLPKRGLM